MADGTLQPTSDRVGLSYFDVEHTCTIMTNQVRTSIKMSDFPRISTLRGLFASVTLESVTAEVRQDALVGNEEDDLTVRGHVFIAVIPTNKDNDAATGSIGPVVAMVPNKQTFALSSSSQSNQVYNFALVGYELDLAQDPRRGAGPVAWLGNSGVSSSGTNAIPICTVTWRIRVGCSGPTPLWS